MSQDTLTKGYEPQEVEQRWYAYWEKEGLFAAQDVSDKPPYSIVIPPPNVTGVLHMGHAHNNTVQDILCRYRRMQGYNVLWMPGTDHAGIATQNVVERELRKEGLTRYRQVRVKMGDRVDAGQVLVEMDPAYYPQQVIAAVTEGHILSAGHTPDHPGNPLGA